jgi:hypothetical protein
MLQDRSHRVLRDPVLRFELTPELYHRQVDRAVATMRAWAAEARRHDHS